MYDNSMKTRKKIKKNEEKVWKLCFNDISLQCSIKVEHYDK